jgi:hypothetical protein
LLAKPAVPPTEDRLSTLRSDHRARGLCDVCVEKWTCGHKCAPTINLQAMQEVWEFLQIKQCSMSPKDEPESLVEHTEQLFLALSSDARRGAQGRQTIQFHGSIQGLC